MSYEWNFLEILCVQNVFEMKSFIDSFNCDLKKNIKTILIVCFSAVLLWVSAEVALTVNAVLGWTLNALDRERKVIVQRLQLLFIQSRIQESFFAYDDIYDTAQRETEYNK